VRVPIKVKFTTKCPRCGLRYPRKELVCTHCSGLSDREVEELKEKYASYHEGNANLGRLFMYIAAVVFFGMLVASLA